MPNLVQTEIRIVPQKVFELDRVKIGVGGGTLLSFLRTQLGFEVFGVEMDGEVLRVARQYFGLEDCEIHVSVGNAIEYVEKLAGRNKVLVSSEDNDVFY
ncbi:hypothetical protein OIU85_001720 [Salix viminalis]|uniref:Methyltransferase type 11 domain-containing protein n=1 Tax=Salix viminalis TaxID=40686 RepID=A0A9Q0VM83_SALVM|nr:hypothetical protein OIU85_001720 [Salix viminalis]